MASPKNPPRQIMGSDEATTTAEGIRRPRCKSANQKNSKDLPRGIFFKDDELLIIPHVFPMVGMLVYCFFLFGISRNISRNLSRIGTLG